MLPKPEPDRLADHGSAVAAIRHSESSFWAAAREHKHLQQNAATLP